MEKYSTVQIFSLVAQENKQIDHTFGVLRYTSFHFFIAVIQVRLHQVDGSLATSGKDNRRYRKRIFGLCVRE